METAFEAKSECQDPTGDYPGLNLSRVQKVEHRYKLREIFELFLELKDKKKGTEYLEVLLRYLTRSAKTLTIDDLKETVTHVFEKEGGDLMATIADKLKEEGRQEGKEEGKWDIVKNSLKKGLSIKMIEEITGFPEEKIIQFKERMAI